MWEFSETDAGGILTVGWLVDGNNLTVDNTDGDKTVDFRNIPVPGSVFAVEAGTSETYSVTDYLSGREMYVNGEFNATYSGYYQGVYYDNKKLTTSNVTYSPSDNYEWCFYPCDRGVVTITAPEEKNFSCR